MKQKGLILFFCITIVLVLFGATSPSPQKPIIKSTFSSVTANPKNLIDISQLSQSDYDHISVKDYGGVFVYKDDSPKQVYFDGKQLQSLELSPSQKKVAFYYYSDEPEDKELSLRLLDLGNASTREIFHTTFPAWDVRSDLHWLGSNHLFFLRHCGTACQGITLLNIETGEIRNALLSYTSFPDQPETTSFQDWFGREYQMDGLVHEVTSQTIDNNHYLVFILEDETGKNLGEKRILFSNSEMSILSSTKL